jgi:hypothetical protein
MLKTQATAMDLTDMPIYRNILLIGCDRMGHELLTSQFFHNSHKQRCFLLSGHCLLCD